MIKIYQQHFVPASKGLITSAPSSLIPDGAFQETMNVRFGDGYLEKVEGFKVFSNSSVQGELDNSIMHIGQYMTNTGEVYSVIHTRNGVYCINDGYQYDQEDSGMDGGEDISQVEYTVNIIQVPHQTIKVTKFYGSFSEEFTTSFTVREPYWRLIIQAIADEGYLSGDLIINEVQRTDGQVTMRLDQDLTISATNAEQGYIVYINGNRTVQNLTNHYNFYYDEDCTQVVYKGSLTGKVIVIDKSDGLPYSGEGIVGAYWDIDAKCSSIREIDVSSVDVSSKTNLNSAFQKCSALEDIYGLEEWNPINVSSLYCCFCNDTLLIHTGNISNWSTPSLTTTESMFEGCQQIRSIDLHNWYTPNLENVKEMFRECSSLRVLDISGLDFTNVTASSNFLYNNGSLKYIIMDTPSVNASDYTTIEFRLNSIAKILVPRNLVDEYKVHPKWSSLASRFEAIEDYDIVRVDGEITVTPMVQGEG